MKKGILSFCFMLLIMLLIVGCSDETKGNESEETNNGATDDVENDEKEEVDDEVNNEATEDETDEPEEVTVSLMIHWGEKEFEEIFNQHIEKALPHINLEYIQASGRDEIEESFAKGDIPDIVMGSNPGLDQELDLLMDQMPLVEKHGLDLDKYDPNMIESLIARSPVEGELNALPVFKQGYIMAYNKDIFDAFGVPYPEDNMTWDEAIELGKQLTGERNGETYHGIFPDRLALTQVSNTLIDPETDEPNILENEELRIFLERLETIFNIPGNLPEMDSTEELADYMYGGPGNADPIFDYALYPTRDQANGFAYREGEDGLNFDWVTYPTWGDDYPDYTPSELLNTMFVTKQSENPDAAFEVLEYLMSEEYQKWSVSTGGSSALLSEDIHEEFGTGLDYAEVMAEKNTDAIFLLESAPIPNKSPYESASVMENAYRRLLEGQDVNTVLRKMDEETRISIEEQKGKE